MPVFKDTIFLKRPIDAVFDVATTPKYWPEWHPDCKEIIGGAADHPIQLNETTKERIAVAGKKGFIVARIAVSLFLVLTRNLSPERFGRVLEKLTLRATRLRVTMILTV